MNMTLNFRSVEKTDGYVLKEANVIIERRRMIMKVLSSALFSLVIRIQCGSIPAQSIAMCSSYRSLAAVLTRVVEIFRQLMRSLYRGISAYLDSLWRLLYLANAVIHVCFSKVGRLRDSDTQRSIDRLDLREMLGRRSAALSPRSSNIQIRMVTSWLPLVALPQATASLNR